MLDTDICSYIMREKPLEVLRHFDTLKMEQFSISIITYAEFMYGIENSLNSKKHRITVEKFILHVDILPWDQSAAKHYGQIRAELQKKGNSIGAMDMMIAGHARSIKRTLVTNNEKHFSRVSNLKIENWTSSPVRH
jgi:tRNA(fMet)-specific endonuclease VapC